MFLGLGGTATYFGNANNVVFCYRDSVAFDVNDRLGLSSGSVGSVQTAVDDNLSYTFGYPFTGGTASYRMLITKSGNTETKSLMNAAPNISFSGESDRYVYREYTIAGVFITEQEDLLGDAVRVQWRFTNTTTAQLGIGMWSGMAMMMLSPNGENGTFLSGFSNRKLGYIYMNGIKPPRTERRFTRLNDGGLFPEVVDFLFSQSSPYGMRLNNGPLNNLKYDLQVDNIEADSQADEFVIGQAFFLLGFPGAGGTMPDVTFAPSGSFISDIDYRDDVGYIQKYYPTGVAAGGTRRLVQYYHTPWSVSDYSRPYVVVVDTPKVLTYDETKTNGVGPVNPATWRVWVDNSKGFSTIDREITLTDTQVTLKIKKGLGFTITSPTPADQIEIENGKQVVYTVASRTIDVVRPRTMSSVDFTVVADGTQNGELPYTVIVDPAPVPKKTITGSILASASPRLVVRNSANLVTVPWNFTDSSLSNILGLQITDFQAFAWDPVQGSYVIATSAERGRGFWLISPTDYGITGKVLQGSPASPTDGEDGAKAINLKPGWNLVGNPYSYPIQLGQMTAFAASNPKTSVTWADLVASRFVNSFIATWNNDGAGGGGYTYLQGDSAILTPNAGYWVFNATSQDIILQFPPLYQPGAPGTTRAATSLATANLTSKQTERDWRLQLVARSNNTVDDSNFIGVASSTKAAASQTVYKAPASPTADLNVYMDGQTPSGRAVRIAQQLSDKSGAQGFDLKVESLRGGDVTLTWPNLRNLPSTLKLRLIDTATGVTRNMRMNSGYTYTADSNTTRAFRVEVESGNDSRPLIGDVNVVRPTRDANGVYTISYSLNTEAITNVRILSGSREILSLVRGRADKVGTNSTTWNLRDNANRAVAPGTYRVEITAETPSGDRVRKIVTVNVIR